MFSSLCAGAAFGVNNGMYLCGGRRQTDSAAEKERRGVVVTVNGRRWRDSETVKQVYRLAKFCPLRKRWHGYWSVVLGKRGRRNVRRAFW